MDKTELERRLNNIWKAGDRDECSIKHIWHASAAIVLGKKWSEGADYNDFGFSDAQYHELEATAKGDDWDDELIKKFKAEINVKMVYHWSPIQEWVDEVGTELFYDTILQTKFSGYGDTVGDYIVLHWFGNRKFDTQDVDLPEWAEIVDGTFKKKED